MKIDPLMKNEQITIRKARISDVEGLRALIAFFAQRGELLPRSLSELYSRLRDFFVCYKEGEMVGCCSLHICWKDLAEIQSLSVREDSQFQGIGSSLLQVCLMEARDWGIQKVFTLTTRADFFKKHGFQPIEKSALPHKIWADCLNCMKFPDCDEIALILHLENPQSQLFDDSKGAKDKDAQAYS